MVEELITMDMPIESVYHDYKLVADSIVDDESFQKADTGILLSNLYDVVKVLEKQVPKRPIERFDGNEWLIACPSCKKYPFSMDEYEWSRKFCGCCGQAIKWE